MVRSLSIDSALMSHVSELIAQLVSDTEWLEVGDSVDDVVNECWAGLSSWYSNMMVGAISQFMGPVPDGWLPLDGSTYNAVDYPELYEQLDVVFKDVPGESFTLPNLYDRVIVGSGGDYGLGGLGGSASVTLSVAEMPPHTHGYIEPLASVSIGGAGPPIPAVPNVNPAGVTTSTGDGGSHENMPPYVALWFAVFAGRV